MSAFKEYPRYDATSLAALIRERQVSALEVCEAAIARIEANQPLNAICANRRTLALADARDNRFQGPLAGVPFLLKDLLMGTSDMPISFGSNALANFTLKSTPALVQRYQNAGLNILGMTTSAELGLMPVTETRRYGVTRNPWDLSRNAGGSSGGTAAAVAARITPIANATDGGGSIRIPASCCGVYGFKPSRGRVSLSPYGDLWDGAVVCHAITRSVRDSALLLDISVGADALATQVMQNPSTTFSSRLDAPPPAKRIAVYHGSPLGGAVDGHCIQAVELAAKLLAEAGHHVEVVDHLWDGAGLVRDFLPVLLANAAADLQFVAEHSGQPLRRNSFEETTWLLAQAGKELSAESYAVAKRSWMRHVETLAALYARYDLIVTPTLAILPPLNGQCSPKPAEKIALQVVGALGLGGIVSRGKAFAESMLKSFEPFPYTLMASVTGCPAASVPLYWTAENLPVGIQLMAPVGQDALVLQVSRLLEQVSPWEWRQPPQIENASA